MNTGQAGPKKILVVEDDFILGEMLSALLAGGGYQIAIASNGQEALERLRGLCRPHLILLDLMMPVKDGYQFLSEKCADEKLAPIPVVVCTAAGDVGLRCEQLGARDVLRKPVEPAKMLDAIKRHCG
jgi:CheY-like chemotaxis protein